MECEISSKCMKLFAKTFSCLAKIGEDLFIEASDNRLTFRTLNLSRSVFVAFFFDRNFFQEYVLEGNQARKYQTKVKSCQAVFKQYKTVEKCLMRLDQIEQKLVFELFCKYGVHKKFSFPLEDCDSVQAVYSKNQPNTLVFQPKKLTNCVNNFHSSIEEITLIATKDLLKLKSHVDEAKSNAKIMQTEMSLEKLDFEDYTIEQDCLITFSLKEFKTALQFCENTEQVSTLYFEHSGRPVILSTHSLNLFEADFVLATLVEGASQSSSSATSSQSSLNSAHTSSAGSKKRKASSMQSSGNLSNSSSVSHVSHSPSPGVNASFTKNPSPQQANRPINPPKPNKMDSSPPAADYEEYVDASQTSPKKQKTDSEENTMDEEVACSQEEEEDR